MTRFRAAILKRTNQVKWARYIGVRVGDGCRLINVSFSTEPYLVRIGNHVSATQTHFETHDGGVWVLRDDDPDIDVIRPINIGSNVYFGINCIVLPGVTIGDNVIVGAGSIVTRDIPAGSVAVGSPARVIKSVEEYRDGVASKRIPTKRLSEQAKKRYLLAEWSDTDVP